MVYQKQAYRMAFNQLYLEQQASYQQHNQYFHDDWVTVTLTANGANSYVSYYNVDDNSYYNSSIL